jgi:hypothetical protein
VPLVVDVHGGPLGAWADSYSPFTNFLVGRGWAVLRANPRGSSGRGPAFAAANKNDLGGGDYRDIMAGVDAVLKQFPVDPVRMALIGYSYGGEMAGFVEGKTDRFKAIVSGAPVIDQFSEYGTEGDSWYDRWYFGKPWEHMADAWRQSPLAPLSCCCRAKAIPPTRWGNRRKCTAPCARWEFRWRWCSTRVTTTGRWLSACWVCPAWSRGTASTHASGWFSFWKNIWHRHRPRRRRVRLHRSKFRRSRR